MSITQRQELLSRLYRCQIELHLAQLACCDSRALNVGVSVKVAQDSINEAINDFKPDAQQYQMPPVLEMPTPKF